MQTLNEVLSFGAVMCLLGAVCFTLLAILRFNNILIKLVALEVLVNLLICGAGLWAVHIGFTSLLDICIALSLIMFLSTVAYCQFLMKKGTQNV